MKKKFYLPAALLLLIVAAVLLMQSPAFSVEKINTTHILEAGTTPDFVPSDFLTGDPWCVQLSYIDDSAVNHKQVGQYPVYIYHGFEKYTSLVEVTDTTAPTINCRIKNITLSKNNVLSFGSLGADAYDVSGIDRFVFQHIKAEHIHVDEEGEDASAIEDAFLNGRDLWADEYTFDYGGSYLLTMCAMDPYNNRSYYTIQVTIEEAPVLTVAPHIYLALGQGITLTDHIQVRDYMEPDYGPRDVIIDSSKLDLSKTGDYEVLFTATDDYGLSSYGITTVHVRTPLELQDLINTQTIVPSEHVIIGALNSYDTGYSKEEDIQKAQELTLPSIVHIENDSNNTHGSGFIISIDEKFVTIATNYHVIQGDYQPEIIFHDGTSCEGLLVSQDIREDMAFLRISVSDSGSEISLPPEYVDTLRSVHMNEGYWEQLDNEANITIFYQCIGCDGELWQETSGHLVYKEADRTWNEYENINECIISPAPVGGTSGSPVFDGHGRLISMIRGYTDYGTYIETVTIPLCEILDYYEMVFRKAPNYQ